MTTSTIGINKLRRDLQEGTMKRMGPLVHVFFHYSCFYVYLIIFIGFTGIVELWKVIWEGTMRRTGPNDTNHIVWAISMCFSFSYFLIFFTNSYLHVL